MRCDGEGCGEFRFGEVTRLRRGMIWKGGLGKARWCEIRLGNAVKDKVRSGMARYGGARQDMLRRSRCD